MSPNPARSIVDPERLRQLFDKAPGFMAISSGPDHVFEMVNAAYQELVGPRQLVGKTVREAFPDLKGQGFFELLDHVFQTGEALTGREKCLMLRRHENEPLERRYLDFVFQPITDEDGAVTGLFVQGNDVSEHHVATLALRESEERFRLIADSAPVPMWVTQLDRKRGFVNRAYVEFLNISYEEAVDFDWREIIHPDDLDRIVAESVAGEMALKPFVLEGRYRRHDGQWRWLQSVSQPRLGPDGEHIGFIGVAHDITEAKEAEAKLRSRVEERTAELSAALDRLKAEVADRVRAEEALRQAQKMEAVGQLTGGIAHDFNNLLTPILGGLEIIASRVEDERLKRIATTALASSQRGAKLTSQLLAFSRIQRISMAPVAVNDVIANMKDLLRQTIGSAMTVETKLHPEVGHGICDANQLETAVLNLAINARDAMPQGGRLTISTDHTTLTDAPDAEPGDYVCISVADTGTGMTDEVRARAIEPFFSTKPVGKGTGLGLAQVYGIARQSGGTLRIESEEGKGTIVHLLLPKAAGHQASAEQPQQAQGSTVPEATAQGAAILLIDDDADVRSFLTECLENLGHTVVSAESGEEGLDRLKEAAPDLLLLDYAMPSMHGADVARIVRKTHPDLPIVFVTGYAESDQIDTATDGKVAILRKPFSSDDLRSMLDEKLPRRSS